MKFRVWDKDYETFVNPDSVAIRSDGTLLLDSGKEFFTPSDPERFVVDFNTGLKDKNGAGIYERDILDFDSREWGGSNFGFELVDMKLVIGEYGLCGSMSDLSVYREVVGNAHEDPEIELRKD